MENNELFRELQEEARRDRALAWWKRYGKLLIGGSVALVVVTAAFVAWEQREARVASDRAARLTAALMLPEAERAGALAVLAGDAPSSPAGALAAFQAAALLEQEGKNAEALALYRRLVEAKGLEPSFANLARALYANLALSVADAPALPGSMPSGDAPFAAQLQEAQGWGRVQAGEFAAAAENFRQASLNAGAASSLRLRTGIVAAYLEAGGAKGQAPAPKPEQPKPEAAE